MKELKSKPQNEREDVEETEKEINDIRKETETEKNKELLNKKKKEVERMKGPKNK